MVFDMVKAVMEYPLVVKHKFVLASCDMEISKEVAKVVLYNMTSLYMGVRVFYLQKTLFKNTK